MIHAVADTHTVIWYIFGDQRLSLTARSRIEGAAVMGEYIGFSSITFAEIVYLTEKGRVDSTTTTRLLAAIDRLMPVLLEIPFDRHISQSMQIVLRTEVPDMPDRIVAATAVHLRVPVISRDRKIRLSAVPTIW